MTRLTVLRFVLSLACAAGLGAGVARAEERAEVWVISGQSNAQGQGKLPGLEPNPLVEMYDAGAAKWATAKEPLALIGKGVGPWHAAALEVAKAGTPVRMTGYTAGAMPISYWRRGGAGLSALSGRVRTFAKGANVFLWYQGEEDALLGRAGAAYLDELRNLAAQVRADARSRDMTIVVVQVGADTQGRGTFMPIREAQRQFVALDRNALLVTALGREMQDQTSLSRDGYLELGREIGRALLKGKKADVDWPGPVLDAAAIEADGKTVTAHFAEVKKLAGCLAADFGATDAKGEVKCVKAVADNTRVTLVFERAIALPAKLVYGFGNAPKATLTDEAGNRAPAVQLGIVRGKTPADEPSAAANGAGAPPALTDKGPLADGTFEGTARGHVAGITVSVTIKDEKITDVRVVNTRENRPLNAQTEMPKRIVKAQSTQVDAVTGATWTSRGVLKAVENALDKSRQQAEQGASAGPNK